MNELLVHHSALRAFRLHGLPDHDDAEGCWLWRGNVNNRGYGVIGWRESPTKNRGTSAHRVAYQLFKGEIPDGYEIDHLCRVILCCRPDHLEAVTPDENRRRAVAALTHCPHGHEYDEANTYLRPDGAGRDCRSCRSARNLVASPLCIKWGPTIRATRQRAGLSQVALGDLVGLSNSAVSAIERQVYSLRPDVLDRILAALPQQAAA